MPAALLLVYVDGRRLNGAMGVYQKVERCYASIVGVLDHYSISRTVRIFCISRPSLVEKRREYFSFIV